MLIFNLEGHRLWGDCRIICHPWADVMFLVCCRFQMYVSELSEKVRAERLKNPPVMIEAKTTDQAMQKIRCVLQKNVSPVIFVTYLSFSFELFRNCGKYFCSFFATE